MIAENLKKLNDEIGEACENAGRKRDEITLIAVSKTWPAQKVREAYEAGQKVFGENYTAEALEKMHELHDLNIQWHFIGGLQSKKVKDIVGRFSLIHSIDRLSLVEELEKRSATTQDILIQVNFESEESKSGVHPDQANILIQRISQSEILNLKGLMVMPPLQSSEHEQKKVFEKVRHFREGKPLIELSMGTSHDYRLAIEYGSTMIRVGTAVFGQRK